MEAANSKAEALRKKIIATEEQLRDLREQLAKVDIPQNEADIIKHTPPPDNDSVAQDKWPLSSEEYKRYGRQMIVPSIGIRGQLRLKSTSVLIIGAGGLGCPAAAYLAGAGFGTVGIVDSDVVETSNLHRQILHTTANVGMKKVDSVISYLREFNPNLKYNSYPEHLTPQNAQQIAQPYDLILDCTDRPTSRYLVSDICVLLRKPLISASALRTDGQLIVLNHPALPAADASGGPCYRCLFSKPPPAENVVSCGEGGILGPVVGVMGVLMAGEAVRLVAGGGLERKGSVEEGKLEGKGQGASMLLYSAPNATPFRTVKIRGRRANCFACSANASFTLESLSSGSMDYVQFCGITTPFNILAPIERISATDYALVQKTRENSHLLVDVREKVQFDICNIKGSVNIPFSEIEGGRAEIGENGKPSWMPEGFGGDEPIYVVCRLGNYSQFVVKKLKDLGFGGEEGGGRWIGDIKGGLSAWREEVDGGWPDY